MSIQTIFEHSKAKFDQLVQSGQVLQHYTHVLQLLLRLRQACNHPLLPSHREQQRRQQFIDLICPAQDPLKCRSRDALGGLTSPSPVRPAQKVLTTIVLARVLSPAHCGKACSDAHIAPALSTHFHWAMMMWLCTSLHSKISWLCNGMISFLSATASTSGA